MFRILPSAQVGASLTFAFVIFQLFTHCVTSRYGPDHISIDETDSTSGIAVFSISVGKSNVSNYSIKIVQNEYEMKGAMEVNVGKPDVKNDSVHTFYRAMVLPAGEYRIYGWTMTAVQGRGEQKYFPKGNFSIPFTIRGGQINYLGDYLGVTNYAFKFPFNTQSSNKYYIVSDQFQESLNNMKIKFPKLEMEKAVVEIPDFASHNKIYSGMYLKGVQISAD